MEKRSFNEFVKEILEPGYDWYVKLHYPAPTLGSEDPKLLKLSNGAIWTPEGRAAINQFNEKKAKCVRNWIGEIMLRTGTRDFRYIKVTEDQPDFSSQYHALFGGCSIEKLVNPDWLKRWKEMSGGYAFERTLNDRIEGLLAHLVMREGHGIEVFLNDPKVTYTRGDFQQWKPKV